MGSARKWERGVNLGRVNSGDHSEMSGLATISLPEAGSPGLARIGTLPIGGLAIF